MNKVIMIGRLTKDVELRTTPQGVSVCSFSIAVNRRFKNANGEYEADFINCVAWRQTAEFISRYFHKGSCICIVGNIQVRSWTDQNNQKRYATEVIVDEANFVDSASENRGGQSAGYNPYAGDQGGFASPAEDASHFEQVENEDDLPF